MGKPKKSHLKGLLIKAVTRMSPKELSARGWDESPAVIVLEGGHNEQIRMFPVSDTEENHGGTIFGDSEQGAFYVFGGTDDHQMLVGRFIREVRPMTFAELERQAWTISSWEKPPLALVMTGAILFPSKDPEGNGPGIWALESKGGRELI